MEGSVTAEDCNDLADPTTCAGAADFYCCGMGDMAECYDNTLLMALISFQRFTVIPRFTSVPLHEHFAKEKTLR